MVRKRRKSVATIDGCVKNFNEVMERSGVEWYLHQNNILLTTIKNVSVIINIQSMLWDKLINKRDFKSKLLEPDITTEGGQKAVEIMEYGNKLEGIDWIPIDGMDLYDGKIIPIHLDGYTYDAPISKESIPLKFRKAEFNNFWYKIFTTKTGLVMAVQKRFDPIIEVPLSGFSVASLYHIV